LPRHPSKGLPQHHPWVATARLRRTIVVIS
jgi:hypothetical protein